MKLYHHDFKEIWVVDFEFHAPPGCRPIPICMVAKELRSGRTVHLDEDTLRRSPTAPFDTGRESLFVAYYASAEFGCFLALGWSMPVNVIDLFAEFRNLTNGRQLPNGRGLFGALVWCGLSAGDVVEKEEMRLLAVRGGPYSADEMAGLVEYCEHDVQALDRLWPALVDRLDCTALLRGRYMKAVAWMEWTGIPLDVETLGRFKERWFDLQQHLKEQIDPGGELWIGGSFSERSFSQWLRARGIPWPVLETGKLKLDDDTFSDMAKLYPQVRPIREVRRTLAKMKLNGLTYGPDGRNRALLSPFQSLSGRNQPSTSGFIFGNPSWIRPLIKPESGRALAYIDWSQQEFGIGAVLSEDEAMREAYTSSDPYLAFAKLAGAVPPDATKRSHPNERNTFKTVVLGVGYGMSAFGLAAKLGVSFAQAEELLRLHRRCYPGFWRWSQGAADEAQLRGVLQTRYGWRLNVSPIAKERTLRNFPSQANGAEMMRLAAMYATEGGITVNAPVHDAFLIEADEDAIEHEVARMRACMARASADVIAGFQLDSDAEIILSPDRFGAGKENPMWDMALRFVA